MSFQAPLFLWGLLLVPAALAAYLFAQRRRARYAVRFTNLDLLANLVPAMPAWRRHVPAACYLLALAALLVSLARPRATIPVPRDAATVVMVLDISGSMDAADVQPTRLGAARAAAKRFLDQLPPRFRVALVSFSSGVNVASLPTTDRAAVRRALDRLHAEGGTAMGDAIERAVELAQSARQPDGVAGGDPVPSSRTPATTPPGLAPVPAMSAGAPPATPPGSTPAAGANGAPARVPAAILLLSDGASNTGRLQPLEAAQQAQQAGIPIYTIALGTPDGTLASQDRFGRQHLTPVPPDPATLQQIAEITGGQFFSAPTARDLQAVYQQIGSSIGFTPQREEITFAFAAAGAAFLAAGGALALLWFNRFP
jgi:Ca-activated chloride channel family protein